MPSESVDRVLEERADVDETEAAPPEFSSEEDGSPGGYRESQVEVEEIDEFPEEWKDDFEGLLVLGYLETVINIPYHEFVLQTIKPAAKLEVSQVCQPFENTIGYARAYKAAMVAASLVTVDGEPILVPSRKEPTVRQKWTYVINSWYDPVIDLLYGAVDRLEARQTMVLRHLGVLSGPEGKGGS